MNLPEHWLSGLSCPWCNQHNTEWITHLQYGGWVECDHCGLASLIQLDDATGGRWAG